MNLIEKVDLMILSGNRILCVFLLMVASMMLNARIAAACARTIAVPPGEVPEVVDTEVSTNIPFYAGHDVTRAITLSFALDNCMSNCVQAAFGKDANGDGVLGADETETLYGWRNGRSFAESRVDGFRVEEAGDGEQSCSFAVNMDLRKERGLCQFSITNAVGAAVLTNLSATSMNWLYRPDWNTMRVTRRGPGVPAEWVTCDFRPYSFSIRLR